MRIKIDKSNLIAALDLISGVAKENKIRPVISNTKIMADDKIQLIGTDLEETIIVDLQGEIIEQGELLLDHTEALEYIKKSDNIEIDIILEDGFITIDNAKFTVFDVTEYPEIRLDPGNLKQVNSDDFKQAFKMVQFAAGQDQSNLATFGIRVDNDKLCATDSYRLAVTSLQTDLICTIPFNSTKNISKLINKCAGDNIEIGYNNNKIYVKTENVLFCSRIIDLAFPDFRNIFSKTKENTPNEININRKELIKMLNKVIIFASKNDESRFAAKFIISGNKLTVKAQNGRSKVTEKVDIININNTELETALNVKYILDYITLLSCDTVIIKFRDNQSAFMINDDYLTMPMALRE